MANTLGHPPLQQDQQQAEYTRNRRYAAIDTIGPSAGASLLRTNPALRPVNGNPKDIHATMASPFDRYPPGTSIIDADDPVHDSDSGESDEDGDDEVYDPRQMSGLPRSQPQSNAQAPYGTSITNHGLSEIPSEAEREHNIALVQERQRQFLLQQERDMQERRQRNQGQTSDAEEYAMNARAVQQDEERREEYVQQSRAASVASQRILQNLPVAKIPTVTEHEHKRKSSEGETSLGSPFKHRATPSTIPQVLGQAAAVITRSTSQATLPKQRSQAAQANPRKISDASLASFAISGTMSKDEMLERMADALRKERAKNKSYMKELVEAENEIDTISRMLDQLRNEAANNAAKQLATISTLRRELDTTRLALQQAQQVGADEAERFMGLLDNLVPGQTEALPTGLIDAASEAADEVPINNTTEAVLSMASNQPGGVSAKVRERINNRRGRLDNALSTIASSRLEQRPAASDLDWPKEVETTGNAVTMQSSGGPLSFFRRRASSSSRADVPIMDGSNRGFKQNGSTSGRRLKRLNSRGGASDTEAELANSLANRPRQSFESSIIHKQRPGNMRDALLPPTVARAQMEGTWGRSASSDIPRKPAPTFHKPESRNRKSSFGKIMQKVFPALGERGTREGESDGFI